MSNLHNNKAIIYPYIRILLGEKTGLPITGSPDQDEEKF